MELFDNRYLLEHPWHETAGGWLTLAQDQKLNRSVILWRQADWDNQPREEILRRLGQASRHGDRRFVPVLDVSVAGNAMYAVLVRDQGRFLCEALADLKWNGREILEHLLDLCPAIREARRERLQDFAVSAGNLWLDRDGRLRVINIWTETAADHRDVRGLTILLYQLCSGRDEPPVSLSKLYQTVKGAMDGLPGASPEEAADWAGSALLPSCTLRDYENGIRRLLEKKAPVHTPIAAEAPATREVRRPTAEPPKQPPAAVPVKKASIRIGKKVEEPESTGPSPLRPWILFALVMFGIGLSAVAVFWWMIRLPADETDRSSRAAVSTISAMAGTTPSPSQAAGTSPGASAKSSVAPSALPSASPAKPSEAPAVTEHTVPDLTSKTLEEATQLALKSGLRYSYLLEVHEAEKGRVFKQDLKPGTPVAKGDRIVFWVSKGK